MTDVVPSRLLLSALAWDAAVSGTLALLQIVQPHLAARLFGLTFELLIASGVVLISYAVATLWIMSSPTIARALIWMSAGGSVAWAASCVGVALVSSTATSLGLVYLLLQAIAALALAATEAVGLQRSARASGARIRFGLGNTL